MAKTQIKKSEIKELNIDYTDGLIRGKDYFRYSDIYLVLEFENVLLVAYENYPLFIALEDTSELSTGDLFIETEDDQIPLNKDYMDYIIHDLLGLKIKTYHGEEEYSEPYYDSNLQQWMI